MKIYITPKNIKKKEIVNFILAKEINKVLSTWRTPQNFKCKNTE